MYNSTNEFEVSILVNGRPIPEVQFNGRTYIEGRKNSEYSLFVRNNTDTRVLCIPSVDGLNVLDGEECGLQSPGYVIDRRSTVEIPGWKVAWAIPTFIEGSPEAARFMFKPQGAKYSEDETYAESKGLNPINQGIIGFMVFREKIHVQNIPWCPPPPTPWSGPGPIIRTFDGGYTSNTTAKGSSFGTVADSCVNVSNSVGDDAHLGTGWGEAVEFHTHDVEFERATPSTPDAVFVYYYDTIRNLKRIGVPVEQFYGHSSTPTEANPFPASPHVHGSGCKPPPGWRRKKSRGKRR